MRAKLTAGCAVTLAAAVMLGGGALAQTTAAKPGTGGNVRAAIEAANKTFLDGAAKKNAAIIASVYTEDAEAFPPHEDVVKGRPALQKMWQSVLDAGIALDLVTRDIESSGNLAYETGTYSMKTADGAVVDRGKYCVVWKRVGGEWRLHRDIWSTSMPEAKK